MSSPDIGDSLLGFFSSNTHTFLCNSMIPPDSLDNLPIGLFYHVHIGEIVSLSDVVVVVYHGVVHHRCHTVPLKDVVLVCVPDPDMPVVVHVVQVVAVDDHGLLQMSVFVLAKSDIPDVDILDNDGARSPASVTVIGLPGSQGEPTDAGAKVQPGHSARIPSRSHIQEWRTKTGSKAGRGWRPIPRISHKNPVSIVMGHVPKGFVRNPGLVSVPYRPSAHGEWRPSSAHVNWAPEMVVSAIVVDPFPPAVLFESVGFVMEAWG